MLKPCDDIISIPKIGQKKQKLYNKMGIFTVSDLISLIPRDYIRLEYSDERNLSEGTACIVECQVIKKLPPARIRKGMTISKVRCLGRQKEILLTFFNAEYTVNSLEVGKSYIFSGKAERVNFTLIEINAPTVYPVEYKGRLLPLYPLTQGLSQKVINNDIQRALSQTEVPKEYLPVDFCRKNSLLPYERAVRALNCPRDEKEARWASERIIFDELFIFSAAMERIKSLRGTIKIKPWNILGEKEFISSLPFCLTQGQLEAMEDISKDFKKGSPMNRMIEGDVGSGKTVIAAFAAYESYKNGFQSAVMAPTESLCRQHYETMDRLLSPFGIKCVLLTGQMSQKEKKEARRLIKEKEADVIIGTHALFSKDVEYCALGLTITDEQHRFGVNERKSLSEKGKNSHSLVMSATPIPRTLSLVLYKDLDLTVIKGMPVGRKPVKTYLVGYDKHQRALNFIKKHVMQKKQAYIVCPLIEDSESIKCVSSSELFKALSKSRDWGISTALLNGKQDSFEKERIMEDFKANKISVLISTTVIEVGIDVPNSVIMLIENAERFGLSQLHQLRGRVGRGSEESFCILLSDSKEKETVRRLKTLCCSNDGFFIAEEDLKQRGPGDMLGTRQHGNPLFKNADLIKNEQLLLKASEFAKEFIKSEDNLKLISDGLEKIYREIGTELN